jgi:hypothetical protein
MKRPPWDLCAIVLVVLVGLVALGMPAQMLLLAALVLVCPLILIFMPDMGRRHVGTHQKTEGHDRPTADRR